MISMNNIVLKNDVICVFVNSTEIIPPQKYKLVFNKNTKEYKTDIKDADEYDIHKVINHLSNYIKQGIQLPKKDCLAFY